jgi:hypothetical protein
MSEDDTRIHIDQADVPIDWGNGDGDRGVWNDTEDIGKDFGNDMEWAGSAVKDTWETTGNRIEADIDSEIGKAETAWDQGDYIDAGAEGLLGGLEIAGAATAGVIGTVVDGVSGLGAGVVAVGHDLGDVAADIGGDVVGGVEDVASAIGDGAEDVIDDIEDLF